MNVRSPIPAHRRLSVFCGVFILCATLLLLLTGDLLPGDRSIRPTTALALACVSASLLLTDQRIRIVLGAVALAAGITALTDSVAESAAITFAGAACIFRRRPLPAQCLAAGAAAFGLIGLATRPLPSAALFALFAAGVFAETSDASTTASAADVRFRSLYDANVIGVAFWTSDGVVTDANDELLRIFGISRDILPGWRWSSCNAPGSDEADAAAFAELRAHRRFKTYEKDIVRPDGTPVTVAVTAACLDVPDSNIAFVLDVTERVEARRALERAHEVLAARVAVLEGAPQDPIDDLRAQAAQVESLAARLAAANHELEMFSYSVSHDLRAPLRAVDGFSRELLTYQEALDERGRHYLSRIRGATQRMATLIDDLLNLARLSRTTLRREPVDVTAIAREIAAESPQTRFSIADDIVVSADPHLLRVVLDNVIGNAVKFSARAAEPHVEIFPSGDGSVAVRDNGTGFDMKYVDKIFAPFQRLHSSDFEGTGIGLALVQRIVSRHGGSLRAESAPGNGATFYFTFGEATS